VDCSLEQEKNQEMNEIKTEETTAVETAAADGSAEQEVSEEVASNETASEETLDEIIDQNIQNDVAERLITSDGMVGEQYDRAPDMDPITPEQEDEFDGKEGIRIEYDFTGDEVSRALRVFQKYTIYKKNLIYTLLMAVCFVIFLVRMMNNPDYSQTSTIVCVLTVVATGMLWYFPWNHIRQTAKTVDAQKGDTYLMTLYDNAMVTGEGADRNVFYFSENQMKVWEMADLYVFGYHKIRIFALPKRCCQEREEEISRLLRDGLKENYKMIY
jgi:hypothetical protein